MQLLMNLMTFLFISLFSANVYAGNITGRDYNALYFLRVIQSAFPDISRCDLDQVADNGSQFARDAVGFFRVTLAKGDVEGLIARSELSDGRLSLLSPQLDELIQSGNYRYKRFFVDEGEVIFYKFSSGEQYIMVVEF